MYPWEEILSGFCHSLFVLFVSADNRFGKLVVILLDYIWYDLKVAVHIVVVKLRLKSTM